MSLLIKYFTVALIGMELGCNANWASDELLGDITRYDVRI
jgi:hypothetical protein